MQQNLHVGPLPAEVVAVFALMPVLGFLSHNWAGLSASVGEIYLVLLQLDMPRWIDINERPPIY